MDEKDYFKLMHIIISGCKFKYYSYDHKKALLEYNTSIKFTEVRKWIKNPQSYDMPEELKLKYRTERIGKLRRIHFAPNGKAYKFEIGARYAKRYGLDDFGVNVFPILNH
jgi:hypothetical protein